MAVAHVVAQVPAGEYVPTADRRIVTHATWASFEAQLALRGDTSGPRISYLDGALELMSPSRSHEHIRSMIGRLIDAYALEIGLDFSPYGSWTLKDQTKEAGAEPDECYIFGSDHERERPDLAIEVVWTSGGIDKLEIYRRLGVREVWYWKAERLDVYDLRGDTYEVAARSAFLPDLDVAFLATFLDRPTVGQAVRAFLDGLRART